METPLYAQPEAWSVAIALLALILSQLPPLTQLLRGLKVNIAAPEFIALSTSLGNLQAVFLLGLNNVKPCRL